MAISNTARNQLLSGIPGNLAFDGPTRVQTAILDSSSAALNVFGNAFTVKNSANETVQAGGAGVFAGLMINPKTYALDSATVDNNTVAEFALMGEVYAKMASGVTVNEGDKVYFVPATGVLTTVSASNTLIVGATVVRHAASTESGDKLVVISLTGLQIA